MALPLSVVLASAVDGAFWGAPMGVVAAQFASSAGVIGPARLIQFCSKNLTRQVEFLTTQAVLGPIPLLVQATPRAALRTNERTNTSRGIQGIPGQLKYYTFKL